MQRQGDETDFDRMIADLQERIRHQEREIYSPQVIEEALNPQNLRPMATSDAQATVRGWCGDTMQIYLRLNGDRIEQATFMTDGCGPSVACGSKLTQMVCGKSLEAADAVRPKDLLDALGGLPEESVHCAELAVNTLREAISIWSRTGGQQ
jgi:nitrogen fixation NifU-like protein